MKYYHCSRKHHKVGDIIEPKNYGKEFIWVVPSKTPHFTLWNFDGRSLEDFRYNTYRVIPLNPKSKILIGLWDEIMIKCAVEVVECIGQSAKSGNMSAFFKINKKNKKGFIKIYKKKFNSHK